MQDKIGSSLAGASISVFNIAHRLSMNRLVVQLDVIVKACEVQRAASKLTAAQAPLRNVSGISELELEAMASLRAALGLEPPPPWQDPS